MSEVTAGTPIFVALEPEPALAALILDFKRQTRQLVGDQLFVDDPPHLTMYLAVFASADPVVAQWPKITQRADDLTIRIIGWHIFESDALTGNYTLVCQIAEHDKARLRRVQREIVGLLAPSRDVAATNARYAPRWPSLTADQQSCVEQFGFPYVGDGWQPHLTIASIRPADWPTAWQALESQALRGQFRCTGWRLSKLVDEKPVALDGPDSPTC